MGGRLGVFQTVRKAHRKECGAYVYQMRTLVQAQGVFKKKIVM